MLDFNLKLKLDDLPNRIKTTIIFNNCYYEELNNLPHSIEYFKLPLFYEKEIKRIPKNLKTIKLYKNYEYTKCFLNIKTEYC